jgi:hypothetical protein
MELEFDFIKNAESWQDGFIYFWESHDLGTMMSGADGAGTKINAALI